MTPTNADINQSDASTPAIFLRRSPADVRAPSSLTTKREVASNVPTVAKASK